MNEFKFEDPKLEAHFKREIEDGLKAYELRRVLKNAQIKQIQKDDNCTEQEAAKKWETAREVEIRRVQAMVTSEHGVQCPREDAERIVRRAEWNQAKDLIDQLPAEDSTTKRKSGLGCLGLVVVFVITCVIGLACAIAISAAVVWISS